MLESIQSVAALGVFAAFASLAIMGIVSRVLRARWPGLVIAIPFAMLLGPASPIALLVLAALGDRLESYKLGRDRDQRFFGGGQRGVLHLRATLTGVVMVCGSTALVFALYRFGQELSGEPLQTPVIRTVIASGFLAGFALAAIAKRVAFLESMIVTAAAMAMPAFGAKWAGDLFTYGTAAAYFAVLLLTGGLILLLSLTMGGSLGYLMTGDGEVTPSASYEAWIGRRYLMGKRSNNVVGMITVISVLAVAVGTMAMVVVMSVMNGFSTDLRSKIFGANAHLIVLKYGTDFTEYDDVRDKTREVEGVTGASPFVLNEVMVSSDVNLTGALLKGVDVDTVDEVTVLRENVIKGELGHLRTPADIPGSKSVKLQKTDAGTKGKSEREALDAAMAAAAAGTPAAGAGPPGQEEAGEPMGGDPVFDDAIAKAAAGTPAGRELAKNKAIPGIVIGQEMSRNLKVFVGDTINVVSPVGELGPTGPVPKARAFRVAAIFYSGMYEYDSKFVYIDLEEAQDFFTLDGAVTGIEYKVADIEATQGISREILQIVGGYPYRTKDWMEMNKNLFSALKLEKIAMFIILTFIILVASFLIAATLIVFVIEKGKEIAILKSMGSTDTSIMKVFVTYGLIVGTLGTSVGLAVGLFLCFLIESFGIGLDPDVYYITNLPVHVDMFEVALVGLAAIILSYLATIYPALLAARMRPVEGLRYE